MGMLLYRTTMPYAFIHPFIDFVFRHLTCLTSPNMTRAIRIQQVSMATEESARRRNWGLSVVASYWYENTYESICRLRCARARSSSHCGTFHYCYYYLAAHHHFSCIGDTSAVHIRHEGKVQGYLCDKFLKKIPRYRIHENSKPIHATQWLSRLPRLKRFSVTFFSNTFIHTRAPHLMIARHRAHRCTAHSVSEQ